MDDDSQAEEERAQLAREGEHVPPAHQAEFYHCPYCGVLARQGWQQHLLSARSSAGPYQYQQVWTVICTNCRQEQIWLLNDADEHQMVKPLVGGGPRPHVDMPPDVRADYEEARSIVMLSPRGAAALLRLATQKLVDDLVPGGANLNSKIGTLVGRGLPAEVEQALDVLRVIGNNAVHPGEIVLDDDADTATGLFEYLNLIVEDRIARPKRVDGAFSKLPASVRRAIEERNAKKAAQHPPDPT